MAKMKITLVMAQTFEMDSEEEWPDDEAGAFESPNRMLDFLQQEAYEEFGTRHGLSKMLNSWYGFVPCAVGDDNTRMILFAGDENMGNAIHEGQMTFTDFLSTLDKATNH